MFRRRNTISGLKLVQKWEIDTYDLSYLIMKHKLTVLEADPAQNSLLKRFFKSRYSPIDTEKLIEIMTENSESLHEKLFFLSEVDRIAGEINLPPAPEPDPTEILESIPEEGSKENNQGPVHILYSRRPHPLRLVIEEHERKIKKTSNVFALIGKVWFVKFAQKEYGLYPDQEKYRYIARLLSLSDRNPKSLDDEYSIYNVDLYEKVSGKPAATGSHDDGEIMRELNESDLTDKLSVEDIRGVRKVADDLLEQLKEAREVSNEEFIKKALANMSQSYS
jgi:hypothetical protein